MVDRVGRGSCRPYIEKGRDKKMKYDFETVMKR